MLRLKPRKTPSEIDAVLRKLVRTCHRDVPLYQRLFAAYDVDPAMIRAMADLPHLPFVQKLDFMGTDPSNHLNSRARLGQTRIRVSSGTTGGQLDTHMSLPELMFRRHVFLRRIWRVAGRPLTMHVVQAGSWIAPGPGGDVRHAGVGPLRITHISRRLPVAEQAAAIVGAEPTVIIGCPSALDVVASATVRSGLPCPAPSVVVTRGEILRPQTRRILENVYRCSVVDFYSAEEVGLIAWQCPETPEVMHIEHDACVVEVVNKRGEPVPDGRMGEVAITNLFNRTMPFVRYRIGDRSRIVPQELVRCSCKGVRFSMSAPAGRPDDFIVLPDRQRVSPRVIDDIVYLACICVGHDSLFYSSVRDYQIVQETMTRIRIDLLTDLEIPSAVHAALAHQVLSVHPRLAATFRAVSSIELAPSGKRSRVVSLVRPTQDTEKHAAEGPRPAAA